MRRERVPETEIAEKVVAWLQSWQWEVYQEVSYGQIADIVAVQNGRLWVIETKVAFGFPVINQALNWKQYAHWVSIATPIRKALWRRSAEVLTLQHLGIGWLKVGEDRTLGWKRETNFGVSEQIKPVFNRRVLFDLKNVLREEHKTWAKAGSATADRYTPFKATSKNVQEYVRRHPGCSLKDILQHVETHYHTVSSARACIPDWIEKKVIPRIEIKRAGREMRFYSTETEDEAEEAVI